MKRTKYMEALVELANNYLRNNGINDVNNDIFWFVCYSLTEMKCYKGFRYMKWKDYTDVTGKTTKIVVAGTHNDCDFLEIQ